MLKVGLTGGIGSGKSTVAKIFELLNIPVYYADAATKSLYHSNSELKAFIIKNFGEDIYSGNELNRSSLASLVFNDPKKLSLLNSMVHPLTIKDSEAWIAKQTSPYAIREAALLFESGASKGLDYIIGVKAPVHIRIKRVMERDGLTPVEINARQEKQIDENIKMMLCDFIVNNNEQEMVIPQVLALHQELLSRSASV